MKVFYNVSDTVRMESAQSRGGGGAARSYYQGPDTKALNHRD